MVPPHREKTWSNYSTGLWSWGVLFSILLSFMGPPMRNFWDKRSPVKLAFNRTDADYSDACPVSSGWLVLCSTRSDSEGGYDLYIAHESSGAIYSLDKYNGSINTEKNELGASYCYRR